MERCMVVGDLHISDAYSGRHVDYLRDCVEYVEAISAKIIAEKIDYLFLPGDFIGRRIGDKNLKRRDTLLWLFKTLQYWRSMLKGLYVVPGNHDSDGSMTDFDIIVSLGLVDVLDKVDIEGLRFHGVSFGDETKILDIREGAYNVAVVHNNIQVEGVTTWFNGGPHGFELSTMTNWKGVDFVVAGHIHNPSIKLVETSIGEHPVSLFYPGNGTRPKRNDTWTSCFGIVFQVDDDDTCISQTTFELRPISEVFCKTFDDIADEDEEEEEEEKSVIDIEQLSEILSELQLYNFNSTGDLKAQLYRLAGIDKDSADLALKYIEDAEG